VGWQPQGGGPWARYFNGLVSFGGFFGRGLLSRNFRVQPRPPLRPVCTRVWEFALSTRLSSLFYLLRRHCPGIGVLRHKPASAADSSRYSMASRHPGPPPLAGCFSPSGASDGLLVSARTKPLRSSRTLFCRLTEKKYKNFRTACQVSTPSTHSGIQTPSAAPRARRDGLPCRHPPKRDDGHSLLRGDAAFSR